MRGFAVSLDREERGCGGFGVERSESGEDWKVGREGFVVDVLSKGEEKRMGKVDGVAGGV